MAKEVWIFSAIMIFLGACSSFAIDGDPIPDIDVILEQIPGGVVYLYQDGEDIDYIEITVPKKHIKFVRKGCDFPPGWKIIEVDDHGVVKLKGPPSKPPLRFRLGLDDKPDLFQTNLRLMRTVVSVNGAVPCNCQQTPEF